MRELQVVTMLRPGTIGLEYEWSEPERTELGLRLVRRASAYPSQPEDGEAIASGGSLFQSGPELLPWARTATLRFRLGHTRSRGMDQAALLIGFPASGSPTEARLSYVNAAGVLAQVFFPGLVRAEVVDGGPGGVVQRLELWQEISSGDSLVLTVTVRWGAGAPRVEWATPNGDLELEQEFDELEIESGKHAADSFELLDRGSILNRWQIDARTTTNLATLLETDTDASAEAAEPRRRVSLREEFQPDRGEWTRRLSIEDGGLPPEVFQYYRLYAEGPASPASARGARATALATGSHGLVPYTHGLLPSYLRQTDEPTPESQPSSSGSGGGQLRRFLALFGMTLDHLQGSAQALSGRHDLEAAPAAFLPALARQIGWDPDFTVGELQQRRDIRFAPELFSTVGTLGNLRGLVHRATGWPCRTKEYVHNVLRTNAPEHVTLWDIWSSVHDGTSWGSPVRVSPAPPSRGDSLDPFAGRPTAVVDAGGELSIYWHAQRDEGWDIWRADSAGGAVRALPSSNEQRNDPFALGVLGDEWLFWDQGVEGQRNVWMRRGSLDPERVSEHPAEDSRPTAVVDRQGRVWVFWQSSRRGLFDIWVRVFSAGNWEGEPRRLTTSNAADTQPSAAVDDTGALHLVWTEDWGAARRLMRTTRPDAAPGHPGQGWQPPAPVFPAEQGAGEAPAVIAVGTVLHLFWHTAEPGRRSRLWTSRLTLGSWSLPEAITSGRDNDREPAVVLVNAALRLLWRSQRRGQQYLSRTFEASMRAERNTLADRAHYTFDTRRSADARYGRSAVGVFVDPGGATPQQIEHGLRVAQSLTDTYRPANTRYTWHIEAMAPANEAQPES